MPKMTAIEAAVHVLEKEGVSVCFGVPGAAINPFYSALQRNGRIGHILARHVEGASHMAEGYTRAEAGNIGDLRRHLRPGRDRHDHRPLFSPGRQHSDPLHHRSGAARPPAQGRFSGDRYRVASPSR